jgi:hypothetical protein
MDPRKTLRLMALVTGAVIGNILSLSVRAKHQSTKRIPDVLDDEANNTILSCRGEYLAGTS